MSATARKHEVQPDHEHVGHSHATEYATRALRGLASARPHLRVVSPLRPERASRGLFALIVTGALALGMITILVINTSLAQGAFSISELKADQAALAQQEQALAQVVAAAAAPDVLQERARAMGMVPAQTPVFLDAATGKVLGNPKPAPGGTSTLPKLLTPADATMAEAVDNGAADLPAPLPEGYDPAAADAAAAKAASAEPGAKAAKSTSTSAEDNLWRDTTVFDVTGKGSKSDSGLSAEPLN